MTYITNGGGGGGSFSPVAFDANDLFCWQTTETDSATSWPNHVPGGATATLTRSVADVNRRGGAAPAVELASEYSYICTGSHYPSETVSGADANIGPTNNFTVDMYLMVSGRQETSPQNHWVWRKLRQAHSNAVDNVTLGMYVNYPSLNQGELLNVVTRVRLTSGNIIEHGPSAGTSWTPGYLSPHVWYHVGFTVELSGGNTILKYFLNGERDYFTGDSAVGTDVDWNTGFPWQLGGFYNGTAAFSHAMCRIQRLRVSNVVRPASYFQEAYRAIR